MVERLHDAGRISSDVSTTLRNLRNRLVTHVLPDNHLVFCHGDVHAENVIASSGEYIGLVDFAGAGWLDAAWDFAGTPAAAIPPAVLGYQEAGGLVTSLLKRIVWCRLQLAVHRLFTSDHPEDDATRAARRAHRLLAVT